MSAMTVSTNVSLSAVPASDYSNGAALQARGRHASQVIINEFKLCRLVPDIRQVQYSPEQDAVVPVLSLFGKPLDQGAHSKGSVGYRVQQPVLEQAQNQSRLPHIAQPLAVTHQKVNLVQASAAADYPVIGYPVTGYLSALSRQTSRTNGASSNYLTIKPPLKSPKTQKLLTGLFSLSKKQANEPMSLGLIVPAVKTNKPITQTLVKPNDESVLLGRLLDSRGVNVDRTDVQFWINALSTADLFKQIDAMIKLNQYLAPHHIQLRYSGNEHSDKGKLDILGRTKRYWLVSGVAESDGSLSRRSSISTQFTSSDDLRSLADVDELPEIDEDNESVFHDESSAGSLNQSAADLSESFRAMKRQRLDSSFSGSESSAVHSKPQGHLRMSSSNNRRGRCWGEPSVEFPALTSDPSSALSTQAAGSTNAQNAQRVNPILSKFLSKFIGTDKILSEEEQTQHISELTRLAMPIKSSLINREKQDDSMASDNR
ncbi:hypothetical protein D5R81_15160 [Parashewanella spongiae]|uniref:Uncharacterized protein n=1 Tax=Parashewanella spongiae TaxID=342950 RepID=A0A3A6U392_9GAMM|nr:hypothetical protein [Parashewanella spongiae]MCL1078761.1 hypothetical protein [Parashewanella spongiae]RJY07778.1 hypothetical protein D5R81_15160 [Parashewanella spongiae]